MSIDRSAANVEIAEQAQEIRAELIFIVRVHERKSGAIAVVRGFNRIGEQALSLIADAEHGLRVDDGSSRYYAPQGGGWNRVDDTTHQAVDDERTHRRSTGYPVDPVRPPIERPSTAPMKFDNSPEANYGRSFIHFLGSSDQMMLMVDVRDAGSAAVPRLGLDRRTLEGRSFYDQIGRPDLRKKWFRRKVSRLGLLIAGLGVGVLGTTVAGAAGQKLQNCAVGCTRERRKVAVFTPIGIVGFGVMLVGMFLKKHPVSEREQRRLATLYNDRLQKSLGLNLEAVQGLE